MKRITILLNGNQIELSLKASQSRDLRDWFATADNDNILNLNFEDGSVIVLRRSEVVALSIITE